MPKPSLSLSSLALVGALLFLASCGGSDDDNPPAVDTAAQECQAITDTGSVVVGSGLPGDPAAPEPASGYKLGKKVVTTKTYMVVTANPYASRAGCDVLKAGGTAADAAVAVQAVLGLVEPQSSGLGGGAFMLHYDAKTKVVRQLRRPRDRAGGGNAELPALDRRRHRPDRRRSRARAPAAARSARPAPCACSSSPTSSTGARRGRTCSRPASTSPTTASRSAAAWRRRSRARAPTCSPIPKPPRPISTLT